jgi:environmental stress-induced protein Ves
MRCLPAVSYRRMPWKNGQGITHEIAREPAEGDNFLWRLSIAEVAASGAFSPFPGYDRTIALVAGEGVRLDFDKAPPKILDQRFVPFAFSGDWQCRCRLLGGPSRDFNLMVDRAVARAGTELLRLPAAPVARAVADGWLLVYCAEGRLASQGLAAEAGDTLVLDAGRHVLVGPDALALVMSVHMLRGK